MDPPAQEFELAQRLLDAGVGLHPREEHGEEIGWFRVVFSIKREILAEALTRCALCPLHLSVQTHN